MPVMRKLGFEYELGGLTPKKNANRTSLFAPTWKQMKKGEVIQDKGDYQITADVADQNSNNLEFITRAFDESDEVVTLGDVGKSIRDDINEITSKPVDTDVPLDQLARVSGASSIYIHVREQNPTGQIQMTGGVDPIKLSGLMSGKELGAIPEGRLSKEESARAMPLQNYYEIGIDGPAMGLIYNLAMDSVQDKFTSVGFAGQGMVASAGAMMAQTIVEQRVQPFELSARLGGGSGRFIAKTDYAMILQLIDERIPGSIDWPRFLEVVLAVANQLVDIKALQEHEGGRSLTAESPVFPPYYGIMGDIRFPELTIGQWVSSALPRGRKRETEEYMEDFGVGGMIAERYTGREVPVGQDLLTRANYPGSTKQREELRAYGAYGSKTDPGEKVILEWRDLKGISPDILPVIMGALFEYYSEIGVSGLYQKIERDIPAYRRLVEGMPPGQHQEDAVKHYNFALHCFMSSAEEPYEKAQASLAIAEKYFGKAHDDVIAERIARDRAARYA